MKGRVKEEEKNEKIIRDLLKLPANRRCINCNSLGPQYVCTSFWTFVCATCSGIHREFTHRVKSVSMARFTSEEVIGLRGGGNELAKEVYFEQWDSQRQFGPDNRRYTGEKSTLDGLSTPKMVEKEDSFTRRSGLHNMPYLDIYERHYTERSGSSEKSDETYSGNNYGQKGNSGHGKESQKHDDRKSISAYFEAVNDKFRGHISETTESEANWLPNRPNNLQIRPSNQYKALDSSRNQEVRSLRDILDRIPTLRLSEALNEDSGRSSDGSFHMQRTISTIETRHIDGNSMEPKRLKSMGFERKILKSPVNISSDPKPASQAQQSPKSTRQPIPKPTCSPDSNNSVSIDRHTQENQSKAATNTKILDSLVPASKPMGNLSMKHGILNKARTPSCRGVSPASLLSNVLTSTPVSNSTNAQAGNAALPLTTGDGVSSSEANHVKEKQGIPQPQCFIFPDTSSQSTSHVPSNIQNLQSFQIVSQHIPRASSAVLLESLPSVHTLSGEMEFPEGHGSGPAVISHSCPSEQQSSGRKDFPQNLFTTTYPSAPVRSPGRKTVQAHGMGNGLRYSSVLQVPTVYQPAKSANTFDLNDRTNLLPSPTLSSIASWLGPQPNELEARSLLQSSSFGSPSTEWMPAQASSYGALAVQPSSSTSGMALNKFPSFYGSHVGQQVHNKLPSAGYQGVEVMGNNQAVFSALNTSEHPDGRFSTLATQTSWSSVGGKPFA
ncbi:hypothetical protein DITRI_Ditri19aG0110700 [Diplodiscus trichospermus]